MSVTKESWFVRSSNKPVSGFRDSWPTAESMNGISTRNPESTTEALQKSLPRRLEKCERNRSIHENSFFIIRSASFILLEVLCLCLGDLQSKTFGSILPKARDSTESLAIVNRSVQFPIAYPQFWPPEHAQRLRDVPKRHEPTMRSTVCKVGSSVSMYRA